MLRIRFSSLLLAGVTCLGLGLPAHAQTDPTNNNEQPGSLLVFPLFDNTRGGLTFLTVTNTSASTAIFAHFVYVNAANCLEFDRGHYLSALDTITVRASVDNPNMVKGYVYVYARKANSSTSEGPNAVKFDHLIGQEWIADSAGPDLLSINSFTFKAGDGVTNELDNTDVNPVNGKRDLNGHEYKTVPEVLEFPRFFGQTDSTPHSDLVLLNLTGGQLFTAEADFLVYDNNENQFSYAITFQCWTRFHLADAATGSVFDNSFLMATANAQEKAGTLGIVCGWFTVDGGQANSSNTSFPDAALLGVLLDSFSGLPAAQGSPTASARTGSLPFGEGSNASGTLLSHSLNGT